MQSFLKPFEANLDQFVKLLEISEVFKCEVFVLDKWVIRSFNLSNSYLRNFFYYYSRLSLSRTCAILNFALSRTFFPVPSAFTVYFPIKCLAISNSAVSNYSLSRTNFLVPRKNYSRYLKLSENVAHRNQSMKIFSCVFERVCLIECYFNWFSNVFFLIILC